MKSVGRNLPLSFINRPSTGLSNFSTYSFTRLLIYSFIVFSLSSCFKEKTLAPPSSSGIGQTNIIPLVGPSYTDQFFYSLATNTIVSSNSRFAYDVMFDCSPNTFHIWLNSAKLMAVADVGPLDFGSVTMQDTAGHKFNYERGAYSTDSSAFGEWRDANSVASNTSQPASKGDVYIINLGSDSAGNPLGFIKMQFDTFLNNAYTVLYSDMQNLNPVIITIPKDPTRNYRYLSVINQGLNDAIEPDKRTWDLCFTHYSVLFYLPALLPYQVTGVLTNPSKVQAYLYADTFKAFDSVTIHNFDPGLLQTNRDAIGYEWKRYSGLYKVNSRYTYFISAGNSLYYKLHFISYYNQSGIEGYISFEYVQL